MTNRLPGAEIPAGPALAALDAGLSPPLQAAIAANDFDAIGQHLQSTSSTSGPTGSELDRDADLDNYRSGTLADRALRRTVATSLCRGLDRLDIVRRRARRHPRRPRIHRPVSASSRTWIHEATTAGSARRDQRTVSGDTALTPPSGGRRARSQPRMRAARRSPRGVLRSSRCSCSPADPQARAGLGGTVARAVGRAHQDAVAAAGETLPASHHDDLRRPPRRSTVRAEIVRQTTQRAPRRGAALPTRQRLPARRPVSWRWSVTCIRARSPSVKRSATAAVPLRRAG